MQARIALGRVVVVLLGTLCGGAIRAAPEDPALALQRWFERYRHGDASCRLFQQSDLLLLEESASAHADQLELIRLKGAYAAYVWAAPADLASATPDELIAAIRGYRQLSSSPARERLLAYADLLERLERAAGDATPAAIRTLARVAAHDADRAYSSAEWRRAALLRPHLVRREAERALLRAPAAVVVDVLLELMRGGLEATPLEIAQCARWLPQLVVRPGTAAFVRFKATQTLLHLIHSGADPLGRAAAAEALAALQQGDDAPWLEDDRVARLLAQLATEAEPRVAVALVRLLGRFVREFVVEALATQLAERRDLDRELQDALQDAIDGITPITVDGLADRGAWLAWYRREHARPEFRQWYAARARSAAAPAQPAYADAPRFYGVPIVGRRVVFVIDRSGSMAYPMEGGAATKSELSQRELIAAIGGMRDRTRFGVVFFSDTVKRWPDRLLVASDANRARAIEFVERLSPAGWTDLCTGLLRALGVTRIGEDIHDVPYEERPDQIVLLSDGNPTAGPIQNPTDIIDEIARHNAGLAIRIDTVAFGPDADRLFLERLARANGGEMMVVSAADR